MIYRALRRDPQERYPSMTEVRRDVAHLGTAPIAVYRPDVPPPRSLGDLPPLRTIAPILLVVFTVLAALAVPYAAGRPAVV